MRVVDLFDSCTCQNICGCHTATEAHTPAAAAPLHMPLLVSNARAQERLVQPVHRLSLDDDNAVCDRTRVCAVIVQLCPISSNHSDSLTSRGITSPHCSVLRRSTLH